MNQSLSVIIPAYNEVENLKQSKLSGVYDYLLNQFDNFEMILVNDGSTDKTLDELNKFAIGRRQVKVVDEPHRGKAGTVMAGMLAAGGDVRLFTDFDQSTPIEEIVKLLPFVDRGYDIIIGSREVQGSARLREPWYRHLMGKGFNLVVQSLAVAGIHDTQCGFKLMTGKSAKVLFPKLKMTIEPKKDAFTGAFDVELLFLAKKYDYKIAEVPVSWKHVKTMRVNPIKDSSRMFWQIIKIRWHDLIGGYDR